MITHDPLQIWNAIHECINIIHTVNLGHVGKHRPRDWNFPKASYRVLNNICFYRPLLQTMESEGFIPVFREAERQSKFISDNLQRRRPILNLAIRAFARCFSRDTARISTYHKKKKSLFCSYFMIDQPARKSLTLYSS